MVIAFGSAGVSMAWAHERAMLQTEIVAESAKRASQTSLLKSPLARISRYFFNAFAWCLSPRATSYVSISLRWRGRHLGLGEACVTIRRFRGGEIFAFLYRGSNHLVPIGFDLHNCKNLES